MEDVHGPWKARFWLRKIGTRYAFDIYGGVIELRAHRMQS